MAHQTQEALKVRYHNTSVLFHGSETLHTQGDTVTSKAPNNTSANTRHGYRHTRNNNKHWKPGAILSKYFSKGAKTFHGREDTILDSNLTSLLPFDKTNYSAQETISNRNKNHNNTPRGQASKTFHGREDTILSSNPNNIPLFQTSQIMANQRDKKCKDANTTAHHVDRQTKHSTARETQY